LNYWGTMQRISSYIQKNLLFKPTYLWCMNRWKTQSFETLGTHFAYTLPSIIQKRNSNSNPLRLPRERLQDKGKRLPSPWSFPWSPQCILINWFPRCCNLANLLSKFTLSKGNKDLSIFVNDNGAFVFPKS